MEGIVPIEPASRQPVFVGRQKELTVFHDWLKNNDAKSALFTISGMGGIGKSSLLARMNYLAKKENVRTVFLNGNACPQTPATY